MPHSISEWTRHSNCPCLCPKAPGLPSWPCHGWAAAQCSLPVEGMGWWSAPHGLLASPSRQGLDTRHRGASLADHKPVTVSPQDVQPQGVQPTSRHRPLCHPLRQAPWGDCCEDQEIRAPTGPGREGLQRRDLPSWAAVPGVLTQLTERPGAQLLPALLAAELAPADQVT